MYDHVDGTSSIVLQLASNTGGPGLRIEDTGISITNSTLSVSGTITGNLAGAVLGNVTGDASGSSGSCTGNAATATSLQTARTINGVSFNGTGNITVTAAAGTLSGSTLASGVTASSLTSIGTLASLAVASGTNISPDGAGNGQVRVTGTGYVGFIANDGTAMHIGHNSSVRGLYLMTDETTRFAIDGAGNLFPQGLSAAAGTGLNLNATYGFMQLDTSSIRYKNLATEEVRTELPVDLIDELDPKVFAYKVAPDLPHVGLIAEEAHTISPYLALCDYNDGDPIPETVYWPAVISLLIKAVQELRTR
jgi:hypothetical protein